MLTISKGHIIILSTEKPNRQIWPGTRSTCWSIGGLRCAAIWAEDCICRSFSTLQTLNQ